MIVTTINIRKAFLLLWIFALSCSNKTSEKKNQAGDSVVYYPFSPRKEVDFENGKKQLANVVLNIWRGYSSGNIKGYRKYFADSLKLIFNDKVVNGTTDSVLNIYQERRNTLSTLQAHIDYWHPVFDKEKQQDWVLLWVKQEGTKPGKKMDSYSLHQVWKFNAQGKIFMMQEYRSLWEW